MQKSNFLYIVNYFLTKVLYGRASEEFRQNKWGGGLELIYYKVIYIKKYM